MTSQAYIEIVINSITYRPEGCAWCGATGRRGDSTCTACNGEGSVLVAQPRIQCPHCDGKGREPAPPIGASRTCVICHGSGWVLTLDRPPAA